MLDLLSRGRAPICTGSFRAELSPCGRLPAVMDDPDGGSGCGPLHPHGTLHDSAERTWRQHPTPTLPRSASPFLWRRQTQAPLSQSCHGMLSDGHFQVLAPHVSRCLLFHATSPTNTSLFTLYMWSSLLGCRF